jgi:hypothetical protein
MSDYVANRKEWVWEHKVFRTYIITADVHACPMVGGEVYKSTGIGYDVYVVEAITQPPNEEGEWQCEVVLTEQNREVLIKALRTESVP